ncbi:MAG: aminotransferase class I/II-fold pyridoxal phosphate-dependent enzyme [Bryobacteraceae bacterium]
MSTVQAAAANRAHFRSERTRDFTESVIREMTRLAVANNAVNLAQGFPDFAAPQVIKDAAAKAIADDINQYAITWGSKPFRNAIAEKYQRDYGITVDPEREITVVCGATEGMISALLAVTDPGDELIVFEPYYENYGPDAMLCGATRKFVKLYAPDWTFDREELRRAFNSKTKAIIINSPNNPTGRVFNLEELEFIGSLCREHDALAITDEIYEHILYDGATHVPILQVEGMRDHAILINSMSKTYSVTGWRVGWVLAAPDLTDSIRKVHDFVTVGAAAPLQQAGVTALAMPPSYYDGLTTDYTAKRDRMLQILEKTGFKCFKPGGAYYIMTDISNFGFDNDTAFVHHMIKTAGVAAVPGSSFFSDPKEGAQFVRFCFCKKYETLELAEQRLAKLRA